MQTTSSRTYVRFTLILPLLLTVVGWGSQTGSDLPIKWKRPVGWINLPDTSYNLATCPDGSVYVISIDGSVKAITSDGHVSTYAAIDVDRSRTTSCGANQRLYIAGREMKVFGATANGKLALISSTRLRIKFSKILVTPSGYIFGIQHSALVSKLYVVSPKLRVLASVDHQQFALRGSALPLRGILAWDKRHDQLICVLPGDNQLRFFLGDGSRIRPRHHIDPLVGSHSLLGGNDLVNVTAVADGFVAEVFVGEDRLSSAALALRTMNSALEVTSPAIRASDIGFLVGSAPDRGLYFVAPTGVSHTNLIQSDLVKRMLAK